MLAIFLYLRFLRNAVLSILMSKMSSQSVLHLAFPITSRQSNSSSQPNEDPEEDLLNYQKKRQIFCLGVCQVKNFKRIWLNKSPSIYSQFSILNSMFPNIHNNCQRAWVRLGPSGVHPGTSGSVQVHSVCPGLSKSIRIHPGHREQKTNGNLKTSERRRRK